MKTYKIRKIYGAALVIVILLALTACNKWLDVRPSNQFDEEEQFKTEQGYIDVLIGTYQSMTNENTYGGELSFRFVDVLAQLYLNKASISTDYYGYTARYNYDVEITDKEKQHSPKNVIRDIWAGQYNSVAQLNYLLRRLETRPAQLNESNYNIIKGEALALRAYLHFDLLRLFPAKYTATDAENKAIPYVKDFSVSPSAVLSYDAIIKEIENDLKESIALQEGFQTIDQIRLNQGSTASDIFLMFRQNRMNYWAAKALLARLYLYIGDKENAHKYALEVIDSGQFTFTPIASRNFDEKNDNSNIMMTHDHIFSLYHSGLKDIADDYFKASALTAESSDLFITTALLNTYYEIGDATGGFGTDIRSLGVSPTRWDAFTTNVVYSKKYYSDAVTSNVNQKLIPLIRLPEMYYIAAETSATITEAIDFLNVVRTARGISVPLTITKVGTQALLQTELMKEYRKEYYGEGQLWYFYKRLGYTSISPNQVVWTALSSEYIIPIPDVELEFNPNF